MLYAKEIPMMNRMMANFLMHLPELNYLFELKYIVVHSFLALEANYTLRQHLKLIIINTNL